MFRSSGSIRAYMIFFVALMTAQLAAQELPVYDLYIHDINLINPAFRGRENCQIISLADHHQWLGIKDAPNTQVITAYGRFYLSQGTTATWHGLGAQFYRDANGAYQQINLGISYAFHVRLPGSGNRALSMGIEALTRQYMLDETGFENISFDPVITGTRINAMSPAFNLGIAFYNQQFLTGITVADLLPSINHIAAQEPVYKGRHYFVTAGYKIAGSSGIFEFEPYVVLKINESLYKQVDLNIKALYREKLWFGLSYRHNMDHLPGTALFLVPSAGYLSGNIQASYACRFGFNRLTFQSYLSHELMLSWRLCQKRMGALPCPAYETKKK
jgi:type IX secretion system PorP/SprF family membrane protein